VAELRVAPILALGSLDRALATFGARAIAAGRLYPARPVCKRTGRKTMHALVEHPDGRIEDPSRALGMKVPNRRRP